VEQTPELAQTTLERPEWGVGPHGVKGMVVKVLICRCKRRVTWRNG